MEDANSVEPVQVFIRIRPEDNEKQSRSNQSPKKKQGQGNYQADDKCLSIIDQNTVRLSLPDGINSNRRPSVAAVDDKMFSFDRIFGESSTQEEVYNYVSPHVRATVRGYNTTIFAYGNTGSGKTFTMTGNSAGPGIIPRAISEIFSMIETTAAEEKDIFFYVRLSYVELYNNNFRNLLDFASKELSLRDSQERESKVGMNVSGDDGRNSRPSSPSSMYPSLTKQSDKIEVRECQTAGVFLAGNNLRIPVTTAQEAFQLIAKGNKSRATGSTLCNEHSSRSHAILTLHVESRIMVSVSPSSVEPAFELRLGKMHLIDLAGSERVSLSGAEGDTLVETQNINLSLSALGDVLSALSKNAAIISAKRIPGKPQPPLAPVPYRNSKLTHLLKDSLGGNSKTIMIANIRPIPEYYQQTIVTLTYASRAKKVRNRSLVNRDVIGDTGIHAVTTEIDRLRKRLDDRTVEFERLRQLQLRDAKENLSLKTRLQQLNTVNETEKKQLESQMSHIISSQAGQLALQKEKISSLQQALETELQVSQNRIIEQEKEIKWLRKALDDSAQAAQQPREQLQRMQQVLDALQSQAMTTQTDLAVALKQLDELRQKNTELTIELAHFKSLQQSQQKELNEKHEREIYLANAFGEVQEQMMAARNESLVFKTKYEEACVEIQQLKLQYSTSADRLSKVERERVELSGRWKTNIGALEEKINDTIEDASRRLVRSEQQRVEAEEKSKSMEEVNRRLQDMVSSLQLQLSQLESKRQQLEQSHLSQIDTVTKEIHSLQSSHRSAISEIAERHEREIETLRFELQETLTRERREFSQRQSYQTQSISEKMLHDKEEAISRLRESTKLAILTERDENSKKIQELTTNMTEKHKLEMNTALADLRNSLSREHQSNVNELRAKYESQIERLEHELKAKFNDIRATLVNDHKQEIRSLEHQLRIESDGRLLDLQRELESKNKSQIDALTAQHNQRVLDLEMQYKERERQALDEQRQQLESKQHFEIEQLKLQLSNTQAEYMQAVAEAKSNYSNHLKETITAHKLRLDALHAENATALSEANLNAEKRYQDLVEECQLHLKEEISNALQIQRNRLEEKHRKEIEKLSVETKSQTEMMLRERLEWTVTQYEEKIQTAVLEARVNMESDGNRKAEEVKRRADEDHKKSILDLERALRQELENQKLSLEEKYSLESERVQEELRKSHQNTIENLKITHQNEVRVLGESYLEEMEKMKTNFEELKRRELESQTVKFEEKYRLLEDTHRLQLEKELSSLRKDLQSQHNLQILQMLEKNQSEWEQRLHEREIAHQKQVQDIRTELVLSNSNKLTEVQRNTYKEYEANLEKQRLELLEEHMQEINRLELMHRAYLEQALLDREADLRKEFEAETEQLAFSHENKYQNELSNLRLQLVTDFQLEKRTLEEEFEKEMKAKLELQKETLLRSKSLEVESLRGEYESRRSKDEKRISEELSKRIQETRETLRDQYGEDLQNGLNELRERLEEEHNLRIQEIISKKDIENYDKLQEVRATLTREREEHLLTVRQDHAADLERIQEEVSLKLQEEHKLELELLTSKYQAELEARMKELESLWSSEQISTMRLIEERHSNEMNEALVALRTEILSQKALDIEEIEKSHKYRLEQAVAESNSALTADHQIATEQLVQDLRVFHEREVSELREKLLSDHQEELQRMARDHQVLTEDIKNEIHKELSMKHEEELDTIRRLHQTELDSAISSLRHELLLEKSVSLESLEDGHRQYIEIALTNLSNKLRAEFEAESQTMRKHLVTAESDNLRELREQLSVLHAEAIANQATEFASQRMQLLEEASRSLEEKLNEQAVRLENMLRERLVEQSMTLERNHLEDVEALQQLHTTATNSLNESIHELEAALSQAKSQHTEEIENSTQICNSLQEQLEQSALVRIKERELNMEEAAKVLEERLREQADRLSKGFENQLMALTYQYNEQIDHIKLVSASLEQQLEQQSKSYNKERERDMEEAAKVLDERLREQADRLSKGFENQLMALTSQHNEQIDHIKLVSASLEQQLEQQSKAYNKERERDMEEAVQLVEEKLNEQAAQFENMLRERLVEQSMTLERNHLEDVEALQQLHTTATNSLNESIHELEAALSQAKSQYQRDSETAQEGISKLENKIFESERKYAEREIQITAELNDHQERWERRLAEELKLQEVKLEKEHQEAVERLMALREGNFEETMKSMTESIKISFDDRLSKAVAEMEERMRGKEAALLKFVQGLSFTAAVDSVLGLDEASGNSISTELLESLKRFRDHISAEKDMEHRRILEESESSHIQQIEAVESSLGRKISDLEEEISSLRTQASRQMEEFDQTRIQDLQQMQTQISILQQDHDNALTEAERKYQVDMAQFLRAQRDELESERSEVIASLIQSHQAQLEEARRQSESQLRDIYDLKLVEKDKLHFEEIISLKQGHENNLKSALESQLSQILSQNSNESGIYRQEKQEVIHKYENEMASLRKHHEDLLVQQQIQLKENHERVLELLIKERDNWKDRHQQLVTSFESERLDHSKLVQELREDLSRLSVEAANEKESRYLKSVSVIAEGHENEIQRLLSQQQYLKEMHDAEISRLQHTYEDKCAMLESKLLLQHEQSLKAKEEGFLHQMKLLQDSQQQQLDVDQEQKELLERSVEALSSKIREQEEEKEKYLRELEILELENKGLGQRLQTLEEQIESDIHRKEEEIEKLLEINLKYQEEVDRKDVESNGLQSSLEDLTSKINDLICKNDQLAVQVSSTNAELDLVRVQYSESVTAKEELSSAMKDLEEVRAGETQQLKLEIEALKGSLAAAEQRVHDGEVELDRLNADIRQLRTTEVDSVNQIKDLTEKYAELQNDSRGYLEENRSLSEKIGSLEQALADLMLENSSERSAFEKELEKLMAEKLELSSDLERVEADLGELRVVYERHLEQEAISLGEHENKRKSEVAVLEEGFHTRLYELQRDLAGTKQELEQKSDLLQEMENERDSMRRAFEEQLQKRAEEYEANMNSVETKYQRHVIELEEVKLHLDAQLESNRRQLEHVEEQHRIQNEDHRDSLQEKDVRFQQILSKMTLENERQLESLQRSNVELDESMKELAGELESWQSKYHQLEINFRMLESVKSELEMKFERFNVDVDARYEDMEQQLLSSRLEKEATRTELEAALALHSDILAKRDEEYLIKNQEVIEEFEKQKAETKSEYDSILTQRDDLIFTLEQNYRQALLEIAELDGERRTLLEEISTQSSQIRDLEANISRKAEAMEKLTLELASSQQLLDKTKVSHSESLEGLRSHHNSQILQIKESLRVKEKEFERERLRLLEEAEGKINSILQETGERYRAALSSYEQKESEMKKAHSQDIRELHDDFESKMTIAQTKHSNEIDVLRLEITKLRERHERQMTGLRENVEDEKEKYELDLEAVRSSFQVQISHMETAHKLEKEEMTKEGMIKLERALNKQREELIERNRHHMDEMEAAMEAQRTSFILKEQQREMLISSLQSDSLKFESQSQVILDLQNQLSQTQERSFKDHENWKLELNNRISEYENILQEENLRSKEDMRSLQDQIESLKREVVRHMNTIHDCEERITRVQGECDRKLHVEIERKQYEFDSLKMELEFEHRKELSELRGNFEEQIRRLKFESSQEKHDVLLQSSKTAEERMESAQEEVIAKYEHRLKSKEREHLTQLEQLEEQKHSLGKTINEYRHEIERLNEEYRNLLATSDRDSQKFKSEREDLQGVIDGQKLKIKELTWEKDSLQTRLTELLEQNDIRVKKELEKLLETHNDQFLRKVLEPLKEQLSGLASSRDSIRSDAIEAILSKLSELSGRISTSNADHDKPSKEASRKKGSTVRREAHDTNETRRSFDDGNKENRATVGKPQESSSVDRSGLGFRSLSISETISLSPSLRSSPVDQLVAAILDGDVQGVRSVIRAKGGNLQSEYWADLIVSVAPLHRAVSGLHFHGSERQLVGTLEALIQLGADVQATDQAGNTALHKAIQICTSKCVTSVVKCLIARGVPVVTTNSEGETPLHVECKRVRSASVAVIEALVNAGASVNDQTNSNLSPLSLVLLQATPMVPNKTEESDENSYTNIRPSERGDVSRESRLGILRGPEDSPGSSHSTANSSRMWIPAANALIRAGALWEPSIRFPQNRTQLMLLLSALPVPADEWMSYIQLVRSALKSSFSISTEDDRGCNAMYVVCERLAAIPKSYCPDAQRLVNLIVDRAIKEVVDSGKISLSSVLLASDRTGRTILDMNTTIEGATQSAFALVRDVITRHCSRLLVPSPHVNRPSSSRNNATNTLSRSMSFDFSDAKTSREESTTRGRTATDTNDDYVLYDNLSHSLSGDYQSMRRSVSSATSIPPNRSSISSLKNVVSVDKDPSNLRLYGPRKWTYEPYKFIYKSKKSDSSVTTPPRQLIV